MLRRSDSDYGYTRLDAMTVGAGAAEHLSEALVNLDRGGDGTISCRIVSIFDRTVHLSLSTPDNSSALLAVGTRGVRRGPLMIRLDTPPGFSFQRLVNGRKVSVTSRGSDATQTAGLRFQFDRHVTLDIDGGTIPTLPTPANRCGQIRLRQFAPDSGSRVVDGDLVDDLAAGGIEDGLANFEALRDYLAGEPADHFEALTSSIVAWVNDNGVSSTGMGVDENSRHSNHAPSELPDPVSTLVGRGPGATPAGDDFLAGLLLPLRLVDDDRIVRRGHELLCLVAGVARSESTTMSAALLQQAARGRAAQPVVHCLESVCSSATDPQATYETATELMSVGHTSGSATLSGILTTLTVVFPSLAARNGTSDDRA